MANWGETSVWDVGEAGWGGGGGVKERRLPGAGRDGDSNTNGKK